MARKKLELESLLWEKRKEYRLTFARIKAGKEKNLKKASNIRREIAQILTSIREKQIAEKATKIKERKE